MDNPYIITSESFSSNLSTFKDAIINDLYNTNNNVQFRITNSRIKRYHDQSILFVNLGINNQGIDLVLEFTISFESFYNVPIFNFRVYHNNKLSFDLGGVNDILYWNREVEYLLIDHHILQNPWFQIHPCETSSTLDQHMQSFVEILEYEGDKAGKKKDLTVEYLKVWFNLYGLPTILPDFSLRSTIQ